MPVTRRAVLAGLPAVLALPALAACGADRTQTDAAGSGPFPVTIPHKFGETTITAAPTRVVVVGLTDQDALLALGIVPVAVTKWFGDAPGMIFDWAKDRLGSAPVPEVLDADDGVPVEKIAALAPDLIIGQYAGLKDSEYALLSKIAPTVAQPKEYDDYEVPWQDATLTVGKAVGKPAEAQQLVDEVTSRLAADAKKHPEFAGKTGVVVTAYEGIFIYGAEDPRGRILSALGFEFPQNLLKDKTDTFGWSISAERAGELADDAVVVWLGTEKEVSAATGKIWDSTTAAKQGRGVFITDADGDYYIGHSFVTVLSIPWVLDRYVPQLAAAIDGDPDTAIPSAAI